MKCDPFVAVEMAEDIHELSRAQPGLLEIICVEENHTTPAIDSAIPVIQPINRRVELIVASDCGHQEFARFEIMVRNLMHDEICFSRAGFEYTVPRRIGQVKNICANSLVEILKAGNDVRYMVTDAIVIRRQCIPVHSPPPPKD